MYQAKQGVFAGLVDWWASSQGRGWRRELRLRLRRATELVDAVGEPIATVEVSFFPPRAAHFGAGVRVHREGVTAHTYLGLVSVFVTSDAPPVERLARRIVGARGSRDLSVLAYLEPAAADPPCVQWSVWVDRDQDDGGASWRRGCWFPLDTFLGRFEVQTEQGEAVPVVIPMPEGVYHGTACREVRTWTRPRWPGAWLRIEDVSVEVPDGVPIPGKGEMGYDIDDDALCGWSHRGPVSEAVIHGIASALRTRAQRGGIAWRPSPAPERMAKGGAA